MKAFAYIRVSGSAQVDGDGPDRQREKIAAFCKANGLAVFTEYFDRGISGTVDGFDRPAFVNILSDTGHMRVGEPVCIIVERMDRLARDLMVQELLLAECRKRNIKVYAADQGALIDMASDGGDPTQKFIRQILGAVAEWEKSNIVLKLRAARDRIRQTTGRCEGPKPYGSTEYERSIFDYAKELKKTGHPYGHIAGSLNLSGFKTRTGKPWNKARVAHIFQQLKDK